jgi:DNA-binding SARP family transcriptional activator
VTAPKEQAVLAALLLEANNVVSADGLSSRIWDNRPPAAADSTLHAYIYRLRRRLRPVPGCRLHTTPAGYSIEIVPAEIDLFVFRGEVDRARNQARVGELRESISSYRTAQGLWHGEPMAGIPGTHFQQEARFLMIERLCAYEELLATELYAGHHHSILPELFRLVAAYPFRENLIAQLIVALYRAGRQAEALRVFWDTRSRLREDLGIEPGPELQRLQQAILSHQPVDVPSPLPNDHLTICQWSDCAAKNSVEGVRTVRSTAAIDPHRTHLDGAAGWHGPWSPARASQEVGGHPVAARLGVFEHDRPAAAGIGPAHDLL